VAWRNKVKKNNLPKSIQHALEMLDRKKEDILSFVDAAKKAEEVFAEFKDSFPVDSEYLTNSVLVSNESGCIRGVSIHIYTDDFKKLLPVRRKIRQLGFPAPQTEDYPELQRRSWIYGNPDNGKGVRLCGHLPFAENSMCRYVKVGTKEEDVYELRCGNLNGEENGEEKGPTK
jgi:hypothetical protein